MLGDDDGELYRYGVEPRPWEPDEDATATINYTSGTTARPKGVQMTHRMLWINATTFGWHAGVSDRDVYLHTLPMFHCNGWGMPYATGGHGRAPGRAAQGRRRRDPAPGRAPRRHPAVRGAGRGGRRPRRRRRRGTGPIPGAGRTRIVVAGAPPPTRTIERVETELGWEFIQIYGLTETAPLLTINRTRAEWDDLTAGERAAAAGPGRGAGARRRAAGRRRGRGAGPVQPRARRLLGAARGHRRRHRRRLVPHRRRRRRSTTTATSPSPTARRT